MVEFIIKKNYLWFFFNKSIFLVIVNKKPYSKKVHLLIFQFPSPPTLNNWFFHLLNLYSFVTYFYSSSIHFFCVFSSSSSFSFFFFFFPLTRPHEAKEWQPLLISAAVLTGIGRINRFRWPYRHVSVAILVPVSIEIDPFWPESAQIVMNKKKNKGRDGVSDAGSCVGLRCGDLGAVLVLSSRLPIL